MPRVAVIGAGAAGLCAARYLSAKPDLFEPVVFEKADCIGGTWVFTEETGTDRHGLPIHSSMYKNLKTNLPKEIMAFPDLPFDHELPSYVTGECVLQYLEQYATKFDLLKYIKFHTMVESVKPITIGDKIRWEVTVKDLDSKESSQQTSIFDAVMVCNGQYSVPKIQQLAGQETFNGKIIHSHCFRQPDDFKDSTIVCVGMGPSGQDIGLHLHKHAKKVYLSHSNFLPCEFPSNIMQVPPIDSLHGNTVKFTDGQVHEVDIIMLCTGYEYSFPFLTDDCRITLNDKVVSPLYKHMIHAEYPSLIFIGLPVIIIPFPIFHSQVNLAIAVLEGSYKLPSKEEMEADTTMDLQKRLDMGWPHRYAHKMGDRFLFEYDREVAELACVSPMKPVVKSIFDEILIHRVNNLWHYKDVNYEIVDEHNWRYVEKAVH